MQAVVFFNSVKALLLLAIVTAANFITVSPVTLYKNPIAQQPTEFIQTDHLSRGNLLTGSPVTVPAPTINSLSTGNSGSGSLQTTVHPINYIWNESRNQFCSFSGNPIFPYSYQSPRMHLACRVIRI